jgi:DNA-binding transcriptional ArsR family regulator
MKKQNNNAKKTQGMGDKFSKSSQFLKTLADENRLKILLALKGKTMNVTQIHSQLRLPQNLTSHHISKLKAVGLLNEKQEGTFRNYSTNSKNLRDLEKGLRDLLGI